MQEFNPFDGALLIDKPAGPTSHDVVDSVRRQFQIKKVGHCGTLDPNATGLLIVLLGKATKLAEKLIAEDKIYEGSILFGETRDSHDAQGELIASLPVMPMTLDELNEFAATFVGDHLQTPPMVSAIKKDGVPLYKLARKGIQVERKPRLIHIYQFRFSDYTEPVGHFKVACTKGTYVRVLAHDIGEKVGCGGHLATLRRVASGRFDIKPAIQFEEVMRLSKSELEQRIIPFLRLTGSH